MLLKFLVEHNNKVYSKQEIKDTITELSDIVNDSQDLLEED